MLRTGDPDAVDYEDTDDEDEDLEDGDEQVRIVAKCVQLSVL